MGQFESLTLKQTWLTSALAHTILIRKALLWLVNVTGSNYDWLIEINLKRYDDFSCAFIKF